MQGSGSKDGWNMEMHFKEIELDKWKTLEAWEDVVKWMKRERERERDSP